MLKSYSEVSWDKVFRCPIKPLGRRRGGIFTQIELLAATAINALLLTIFMPALTKVKEAGKRIVCLNLIEQQHSRNPKKLTTRHYCRVDSLRDFTDFVTVQALSWPGELEME